MKWNVWNTETGGGVQEHWVGWGEGQGNIRNRVNGNHWGNILSMMVLGLLIISIWAFHARHQFQQHIRITIPACDCSALNSWIHVLISWNIFFDEIFLHASDTVRGAEDLAFSNNVGEMLSLDFFLLVFSSFVSFWISTLLDLGFINFSSQKSEKRNIGSGRRARGLSV